MPSISVNVGQILLHVVLAVTMVTTGTINTLAAKWGNYIYSPGSNPNERHLFIHPFVQVAVLFMGEMGCLFIFKAWYYYRLCKKKDISVFGPQKFIPFIWAIPVTGDLTATSIMYLALTWTYAASFQMLRGSVIIFTGVLSVTFLGNRLALHQWLGMFTVMIGLVIVGVGDVVFFQDTGSYDQNFVLAGDFLIILAQGIVAIQMTVEEKFIKKYQVPPLQAAGWEGVFGFLISVVLLIPMFFIPWHLPASQDFWQETTRFEDSVDALKQIFNNYKLLISIIGLIVSGLFNFAAITVTEKMNATTRMVLDSVRTIFIWAFSLAVGWQAFEPLQPVGFFILFVGTCIYYNLIFVPFFKFLIRKLFYKNGDTKSQPDINEKRPLLHPTSINEPSTDQSGSYPG